MDWKQAAAEVPNQATGGYMKLKPGANKFRILSAPVAGFEYWQNDNKPVRSREYPTGIMENIKKDSNPKYFWAFAVWNFGTKAVEILQLTQSSIIGPIQELINSDEWGDPQGYSLTVNRKGEGLETEYTVVPSPAQATPAPILQAYKDKPINLEALLVNGNPFDVSAPTNKDAEFVPMDETNTAFDDVTFE